MTYESERNITTCEAKKLWFFSFAQVVLHFFSQFHPFTLGMSREFLARSYDHEAVMGLGFGALRECTQKSYSFVVNKLCMFHELDPAANNRSFYTDTLIAHYLFAVGEEYHYHKSALKSHGAALNYFSCFFGNSDFRKFPHDWPQTRDILLVSLFV